MVSALLRLLQREWSGLHQAAFLLAGASLLSQFLGLLRDRLLAGTFGAGRELDIYYAAFRIPDLLYVTVASFVSVTVLIPVLTEYREHSSREEEEKFIARAGTVFASACAVFSLILFVIMPTLAALIAPGFDALALKELTFLARLMLLSPFLLGLSGVLGSVTQLEKRFVLYALAPVLYNIGIIVGLIFLFPLFGLPGLALGVVFGAVLHLMVQFYAVRIAGYSLWPLFPRKKEWSELRRVIAISIPRTITLAAHQLSLTGLFALASLLNVGSIAIFTFAWNLQSVPLALLGVSYSVAAFPTLSLLHARGEREQFVGYMREAARHLIFWSLPISALVIVLRAHIVRVILGSGSFDWVATRLTAAALALLCISLVAQNLILLFVRGYYACGKTRVPLVVNTLSSLGIIALAPLLTWVFTHVEGFANVFERLLRVEGLPGTSALMMPLAFTVGLIINVVIIWRLFERDYGKFLSTIYDTLYQSLATALLIGTTTYYALIAVAGFFNTQTFVGIALQGLLAALLGLAAGIILLVVFDNQELGDLVTALKKKATHRKLVLPEPEGL
mgnify:CR=1 FL=1